MSKMLRITQFWTFFCLQLTVSFADDIDSDYFFGSSNEVLRARDALDCKNPVNVLYCKFKCKNDVGVCFESKCFCVYEPKPDLPKKSALVTNVNYPDKEVILKYNRRHHIAHFCPNLEEARKCIYKCMKEGKPAFCGKDHICYCGHSYSHHQKQDKLDPAKIKSGFYDLYLKYFGPDTRFVKEEKTNKEEKLNKHSEVANEHANTEEKGGKEDNEDEDNEDDKEGENEDSKNNNNESEDETTSETSTEDDDEEEEASTENTANAEEGNTDSQPNEVTDNDNSQAEK